VASYVWTHGAMAICVRVKQVVSKRSSASSASRCSGRNYFFSPCIWWMCTSTASQVTPCMLTVSQVTHCILTVFELTHSSTLTVFQMTLSSTLMVFQMTPLQVDDLTNDRVFNVNSLANDTLQYQRSPE